MVFTHLPSSIALAMIPIPEKLPFAMFFLILRSCTQSMDVAPRSAFLAAVILPAERTAVMGMMNVVKTLSASLGPSITGALAVRGLFWLSFIIAGSLKATYDLSILAVFATHVSREDKAKEAAEDARREVEEPQGLLTEAGDEEENSHV
jgi:sugar phosphate permease